jgi:hypothetical protein
MEHGQIAVENAMPHAKANGGLSLRPHGAAKPLGQAQSEAKKRKKEGGKGEKPGRHRPCQRKGQGKAYPQRQRVDSQKAQDPHPNGLCLSPKKHGDGDRKQGQKQKEIQIGIAFSIQKQEKRKLSRKDGKQSRRDAPFGGAQRARTVRFR